MKYLGEILIVSVVSFLFHSLVVKLRTSIRTGYLCMRVYCQLLFKLVNQAVICFTNQAKPAKPCQALSLSLSLLAIILPFLSWLVTFTDGGGGPNVLAIFVFYYIFLISQFSLFLSLHIGLVARPGCLGTVEVCETNNGTQLNLNRSNSLVIDHQLEGEA